MAADEYTIDFKIERYGRLILLSNQAVVNDWMLLRLGRRHLRKGKHVLSRRNAGEPA
jgi:hypothetical protein